MRQIIGLDAPTSAATTPDGSESAPLITAQVTAGLPDHQLKALHALNWAIEQARNPPLAKITQQNSASDTPIETPAEKNLSRDPLDTSDPLDADENLVLDVESRESPPDATECKCFDQLTARTSR